MVISPDSMTAERGVSTYNILYNKLRSSTHQSTLSNRLMINWNGSPPSEFDPRPDVAIFKSKDHRESRPTVVIYRVCQK